MNTEDAINVLRIYIKDHQENGEWKVIQTNNIMLPGMETTLAKGDRISSRNTQENTLVNEELISYEMVIKHYKMIEIDRVRGRGSWSGYKGFTFSEQFLSNGERVPFLTKYKDVKKIKLYKYKEFFNPTYKVYLYDKSKNMIFYFSLPCKKQGQQEIYKLLAALKILMPHAEEEYNKNDALKIWP